MVQDKAQEDNLEVRSLDFNLDDDKEASGTDDDQDSIDKAITRTRKELFGSAKGRVTESGANKVATEMVRRNQTWRPITPKDTPAQAEGGGRGATFSAETIFHERSSTPTDGATIASKHHECVVRMRFKLQPCDVQGTLVGLLPYCLAVLQERDKSVCILTRHKSLEAKRLSDLPRDFMDFYDKWGLWEEDIKMFLNTIKDKGQRSFTALFYFRSSVDPEALFAKTLLKMAKQIQHKRTVSIEFKSCQYLDTTRDIIFFNLPFCDVVGLRDHIRNVLTTEKSRLVHKYPTKLPRKDWGQAFQDFKMVRDFVKNTPWHSREEKVTIRAFHKLVLECPREEVPFIYHILKVMKKNRSIYKLLGQNVKIMKNVGRDAPPRSKNGACIVRALAHCLPDVYQSRCLARSGQPRQTCQADSFRRWRQRLSRECHYIRPRNPDKAQGRPSLLWQGMFQNDDGSWSGFYSNGKGCERHKGTATRWSGCPAAHLCFHLLKRGVTNNSVLNLIRRSFTPQAFRDAFQATFKERRWCRRLRPRCRTNLRTQSGMPRGWISLKEWKHRRGWSMSWSNEVE